LTPLLSGATLSSMPKPPPPRNAPGAPAQSPREARLAAALRANLGRRKAQARTRDEPPPSVAERRRGE
jgi:hypothetical protein